MSDFDEDEGCDFSASEDEWKPNCSDSYTSDSDFEVNEVQPQNHVKINKNNRKRRSQSPVSLKKEKRFKKVKSKSSLRSKMFNKYRPPPKTHVQPTNLNLSHFEHIDTAEHETRKRSNSARSDSSGSSVNDHLMNPNDIDIMSSYFDVKKSPHVDKKKLQNDNPSNIECKTGVTSLNNFDNKPTCSKFCYSTATTNQNENKPTAHFDKARKRDAQMPTNDPMKMDISENTSTDNISQLLALGENLAPSSKIKNQVDSDSDMEEVEDNGGGKNIDREKTRLHDGTIQITVQLPQYEKRNKKSADEIEASLKRRINRVIKENQLYMHKVSLLCHLAHGIYCNQILNNPILMTNTLKLLPNDHYCYPKGRTEIKYFESIIKWYKNSSNIKLCYNGMYSNFNKRPNLFKSLLLQIHYKSAICKRDYVLIFVILLRAMGIQCRLVMNLVTLPIRPSQNDLCSLKQKKSNNENKNNKNSSNKTKADKKTNSNKTKLKSKKKYSETEDDADSSYTSFSENDDENIKNKQAEVKQKKCNSKQPTKISEKQFSSKKDDHNTDKNKTSKLSVNTRSKKINTKNLKSIPDCNDKQNDTKSKKSVNLEKLKSTKLSDNKDSNKKEAIEISEENKKKKNIKSTSNEKNKITIKLDQNQRIKRSKSRSPLLAEENIIDTNVKDEVKSKLKQNQHNNKEHNKRVTRSESKSPFPDNIENNSTNTRSRKRNETSSGTKQNQTGNTKTTQRSKSLSKNNNKKENKNKLEIPQLDGADDIKNTKKSSNTKKKKNENNENVDKKNKRKINLDKLKVTEKQQNVPQKSDTDDEFVQISVKKSNTKSLNCRKKSIDNRVLSTDDDDNNSGNNKNDSENEMNKKKMDIWIEVFSELEEQWITIDLFKGKVHCADSIRKSATQPIAYVFAWNNNNTLKDVSPRYCPQWNTATRKLRVDEDWLYESIRNYTGRKTSRDKAEDLELQRMHLDKPLPTTISEYKNHPLYVLQRHLLKFEVIYPPDAPTLSFIRGEPVYARECVHVCHSRDIWLKQARVVKPRETAYKIVKSRPKWDRMTQTVIKDQPLEIFGYWQTMQYDPPTAENGIVPRNAYGNVELFKKCMLPKKTVHLRLPGLNKVCKKLKIDCAPAVIGFDFHQGVCHPLLDGFVVCEEYKDEVIDAWNKEKEEAERKEKEKYLQRVYGNWKKLFRGLLNKQRLERKYGFSKKP